MNVGKRLRQTREALGLSANALSRRAGIDTAQILKIERGECSPRVDTLQRLADGLEVDISVLLFRDDYDQETEVFLTRFRRLQPPLRRAVLKHMQELDVLFQAADEASQLPLQEVA